MNAFFTYIFRHQEYNRIQKAYQEATTRYLKGFDAWKSSLSSLLGQDFSSKHYVADNLEVIKYADNSVKICQDLLRSYKPGLLWYFNDQGHSQIPLFTYQLYLSVAKDADKIKEYQHYCNIYSSLIFTKKEAIVRYLGVDKQIYDHPEVKRIALGKDAIEEIHTLLGTAHKLEQDYPLAWSTFANGRELASIPTDELKSIDTTAFFTKEKFLKLYNEKRIIVNSLLQDFNYNINMFSKESISLEYKIILWFDSDFSLPQNEYDILVHIDNEKELKAAILDSLRYGKDVNFDSAFTVADFYSYRATFDKMNVRFDDAVDVLKSNEDAVKAFNKIRHDKSVSYIEDYYRIVTPDSELQHFVESYKTERETRNKAKNIKSQYSKGFNYIYDSIDLDSVPLTSIISIINNENNIAVRDRAIREEERLEIEREAKRREEERKQREKADLRDCVSDWNTPSRSCIPCFSLYNYYPVNCGWEADEDEWDVRNTVWDFKANPNRPQTEYEIRTRHQNAVNKVMPDILKLLNHTFGSCRLSQLTLVCIPSSKRVVTERRYKDFAVELCRKTGMSNGYNYVSVISDGEAKHMGGTSSAQYSIDTSYFKDKYIVLFDDVITSGRSMESFKRQLEIAGAIVICGISIGKTRHERQYSNPIDDI